MSYSAERWDSEIGVVYFIQGVAGGPIKIGFSNSEAGARARLQSCQVGNPEKLRITHIETGYFASGRLRELELHRTFSHARRQGEWFDAVPKLAELARATPMFESQNAEGTKDAYERGYVVGWRAGADSLAADRRRANWREASHSRDYRGFFSTSCYTG